MAPNTSSRHDGNRHPVYWFAMAMLCSIVLLLAAVHTVSAGPRAQTVPPATAKPTATPPPPATATPKPKQHDEEDNNAPPPEPTETPLSEAATGGEPSSTAASDAATGVVTASRLNVRRGPGTDFAVIGTVLAGEEVSILGRNGPSSWWRICCVSGATTEGWVSAAYVTPNFAAAEIETLVPLAESEAVSPTAAPATTAAPAAPAEVATSVASASALTTTLVLSIAQTPPFVWQGQEATLVLTVVNRGDASAIGATIRDELPSALTYLDGAADEAGSITQGESAEGATVLTVAWPQVESGATVSATVRVKISADIADGTVLDNLAVVSAENAAPYTAGISIGMPPTSLPTFQ